MSMKKSREAGAKIRRMGLGRTKPFPTRKRRFEDFVIRCRVGARKKPESLGQKRYRIRWIRCYDVTPAHSWSIARDFRALTGLV
jgi:hypothetical protein